MQLQFAHLHTHSHYSLLQGLSKIDRLVKVAAADCMPALALTDHGSLYGTIPFYKACLKAGIKPIIGLCAYLAEGSRFEKEPGPHNRTFHLTLLAENETGYRNLIKLSTAGHLDGFLYRPRIDKELLREFHEGLIALSGDLQGEVPRAIWNNDLAHATTLTEEYISIFGKKNFFLEIMHHPEIERHGEVTQKLIALARETHTPLVATTGSYYIDADDQEAHRTLLAVQSNHHLGEEARYFPHDADFSFSNTEQAVSLFKETPDAIENTMRIAERCTVTITAPGWIFPHVETKNTQDHFTQLKKFAYEGVSQRGLTLSQDVRGRLEYELRVIHDKGFAPYFLAVADFMYYARKHNILSTIRGSVAGSLVTYVTKITNVNPLEYNLPFERFLNPERPSAPDIDMDFADDRRDEMIAYAKEKYGTDKVAQIGTFGTMLARGVVRDVTRAMGYPYTTGDKIAKMIPFGSQGFPMTIERAMQINPDLPKAYEDERDTREIIDLARKLEGCVRHVSVHAAGVVITPSPLTEYVPLQRDPKGNQIVTQYDMYALEEIGLLKFDFLGIRNLSILAKAVQLVEETGGVKIDIENIPLDDKKTYVRLGRGETYGLFQLGGAAMTKYLMDLKPTNIKDINAMVALYRPGPMESIPEYIRRKHNKHLVEYIDNRVRDVLEDTFGVITYQDDVLFIARRLAGYSWLEADKLRKAMGKKIPEVMQAEKEKFTKGCIANGMDKAKAQKLWLLIEPFAAYGFGRAHAASYGRVAYQTAYMKANHPSEYLTAVLSAESGDIEEIARIIAECRRIGIEVLPPDINESFGDFTVIKNEENTQRDKVRFGLYTVKNLGEGVASAIIAEREAGGPFTDFSNFLDRVHHQSLNRRSLEALIKCGALDSLGERKQMIENIEDALTYSRENVKKGKDQSSLFGLIEDAGSLPGLRLRHVEPATTEEKYLWEKEFLGLYLSGHPLEKHKGRFRGKPRIRDHKTFAPGQMAVCGGIIEEIRTVTTRRGERMAFVKLADFDDSIEVVFFPKTFESIKSLLVEDSCVAVSGKISHRNDTPSIIGEKVKLL